MQYAANVAGVIIEIYIYLMFFSKFGKNRFNKKKSLIFIMLIFSVETFFSLYFIKSIVIFISAILCAFIISFLFDIPTLKRLLLTFIVISVAAISEILAGTFLSFVSDYTMNEIQNNSFMFALAVILSKFLTFIILKPIKMFSYYSEKISPAFLLSILMLPMSVIIMIPVIATTSIVIKNEHFNIFAFIAETLLIFSVILTLTILEKQEKHIKTTEDLNFAQSLIKNQAAHYKELYRQQEQIKKYRHDSKNFIISLKSKINSLPADEALVYIKEKLDLYPLTSEAINSGNPVTDAIISAKKQSAMQSDVKINTNIRLSEKIQIDETELGVLLGNALDNAIEAASKTDLKEIKLCMISSGGIISIEIENPISETPNLKNLSTTKKNAVFHGIGLKSIKSIAEKYGGHINIKCENGRFILSAALLNSKKDCLCFWN